MPYMDVMGHHHPGVPQFRSHFRGSALAKTFRRKCFVGSWGLFGIGWDVFLVGNIQILNAQSSGEKTHISQYISFHCFPGPFLGGMDSRCFIQTSWFLFKDLAQQELPKSTRTFGSSQEMVQQWLHLLYGSFSTDFLTHTIHRTGIFTYIYQKHQPNVGRYASSMDPMGYGFSLVIFITAFLLQSPCRCHSNDPWRRRCSAKKIVGNCWYHDIPKMDREPILHGRG